MSKQVKIFIIVAFSIILLSGTASALNDRVDVTVVDNGVSTNYSVYVRTTEAFFNEIGIVIGPNDSCSHMPDDQLSTMARNTIKITRGVTVVAVIGTQERTIELPLGQKVGHVVKLLSDELRTELIYYGNLAEELQSGKRIELHVSTSEFLTESEVILYDTETVMTERLLEGQTEIVREGVDGLRQIIYKVDYTDGVEVSKSFVSDSLLITPVTRIMHVGTAKPIEFTADPYSQTEDISYDANEEYIGLEGPVEVPMEEPMEEPIDEEWVAFLEQALRDWGLHETQQQFVETEQTYVETDQTYVEAEQQEFNPDAPPTQYLSKMTMQATAYTADFQSTGKHPGHPQFGITRSGLKAQYGVVAVDPNVIALGTKLYIYGYGYCIAGDTGGAIVGNRVDLYLNTNQECVNYGRRTVEVYILE